MAKAMMDKVTFCRCGRRWPDPVAKVCGVCIAEAKLPKVMRPKSQRLTGRNAVTVRLPSPMTADEKYHGRLMAG